MALTDKLTAIADGFRSSRGTNESYTLTQMAELAAVPLTAEEVIAHADIPNYVKQAALEVANRVQSVKTDDSIVFLAMSDSHHCGEQGDTSWQENTNIGNLHAAQAAKILSYALNMDFVCHLGDLTFGSDTTTSELLHQQIEEMCSFLDESQSGIPTFMTVGNHDTGMYAKNSGTESELEAADYLFSILGARCKGATYGSTEYGYCYRDFADKKLRVICLNSSELDTVSGYGTAPSISETQLLWFAQALYDVGGNSGWNVIVLSHYPLDFYNAYPASDVVKAYVDGNSITLNGTAINFSGHNKAKFIANFHGHTHCFKYAKLNQVNHAASSASEYDAWRISVPNSSFYRNNHQVDVDAHGISFNDDETWSKIIGNAKDTAFVVNVVDPTNEVIHSFTYGAGPVERLIGYGAIEYHKITYSVSNVSISNIVGGIEHDKSYTATITPDEHCIITSIAINMDGIDITSSAYSDCKINISAVTGNVEITVNAAIALACTNQIPISTTSSGDIYNGIGYKSGVYDHNGVDTEDDSVCVTGFIPIKHGDILRLQDMDFIRGEPHHMITFYDSSYTIIGQMSANSTYMMDTALQGVTDSDNRFVQFTINTARAESLNATYIRVSCANITGASILTINEEIIYADELEGTYSVINDLTYATSSNSATSVNGGGSYAANINVEDGYMMYSVTVTMGGTNITRDVYSEGTIFIPYVTGDILITIIAIKLPSYTNQIPISTDTDGSIYNGIGYQEGYRLGSSGTPSGKDGSFLTGFIPCKVNDIIYMKNVTFQCNVETGLTSSNQRLSFYDANKTHIFQTNAVGLGGVAAGVKGEDEIWTQFTVKQTMSGTDCSSVAYLRINGSYIGMDSIITVNEPIE